MFGDSTQAMLLPRHIATCCSALFLLVGAQDDSARDIESLFCFTMHDGSCCSFATDRGGGVRPMTPDSTKEALSFMSSGPDIIGEVSRGNPLSSWPVYVAMSREVSNEECRWHSLKFVDALSRHELWALQMLDSSAKLPPGVLRGNANQLGDFDECLGVSGGKVRGQYCLASLDVSAGPGAGQDLVRAVSMARGDDFLLSSHRDIGGTTEMCVDVSEGRTEILSSFNSGIAVERKTKANSFNIILAAVELVQRQVIQPRDVDHGLVRSLARFNQSSALRFDVRVEPDMCYHSNKSQPMGAATFAVILSLCALFVLALVATCSDVSSTRLSPDKGRAERAVKAFSLRRTVPELLSPADGDIRCVHGLRAVCAVCLYLAHSVIVVARTPYFNRAAFTQVAVQPWTMLFRASIVYTDTFLFLSGLLSAYSLSKELARKGHVDCRRRWLGRYIRLTPAMVALLLFNAYVWEHLGYGPMWNKVVTRNANLCKQFVWRNVLYVQNFFPFEEMLLVLRRWLGVLVFAFLNLSSVFLRYWATSQQQLSVIIHHGQTVEQLYKTANSLYSISTHRATPYLFGIALGCILHHTDKKIHIPQVVSVAGWTGAIYAGYLSVWSISHATSPLYMYDVTEASIYAALSPVSWALLLSWVVLACHTGRGGLLNDFLSCRVLASLSRTSYSLYLTQFTVFFYNVGTIRAAKEFQLSTSVDAGELLTTIAASVALTLLLDLPLQQVKDILIEKRPVKKSSRKTNSNNNNQ